MNIRKITSMTMLLSFVLLVLTSVILYIVPQGRVAYWADWHLWGLTKTQWGNLHINLGFLFLFAGLLHIFFNWGPLKAYMKNRARELRIFTASFNVAMMLIIVVGVGTYLEVPPMSTIIHFGNSIKNGAAEKYGEPPYGHAELSSLKLFAKRLDLDLAQAVKLLEGAGIRFHDTSETLAGIASANQLTPQELYKIIKPATRAVAGKGKVTFPDSPMPGFGNKTLAEVCTEFNLLFPVIQRGLGKSGIKAGGDMTIKEIAAANDMKPMSLFEKIHGLVNAEADQ